MVKQNWIAAAVSASALVASAALAQTAAPITSRDVIGEWSLRMTPVEGQGRTVTFQSKDGRLVVTSGSGGMRMIFTLASRIRQGFAGTVDLRVRFLPIGGAIGTVEMLRR